MKSIVRSRLFRILFLCMTEINRMLLLPFRKVNRINDFLKLEKTKIYSFFANVLHKGITIIRYKMSQLLSLCNQNLRAKKFYGG